MVLDSMLTMKICFTPYALLTTKTCIYTAMTLVLIAAMAVSFGTMDWVSGGVIAALVVLNVGVGTVNEYKAEKVSYYTT